MTRRVAAVCLAMLTIVAGCGLSEDDGPQAIAPENLPPDLLDPTPGSSTTLPESPGTTAIVVYFLEQAAGRTHLAGVQREVNDPSKPGERVTALLVQPSEAEAAQGFTTSIPPDTRLLDVEENREENEITLFLSAELFDVEGEELARAFAQMVWTVTEPETGGFRQVRFVVDGQPIQALDAELVEKEGAAARSDYRTLAPI